MKREIMEAGIERIVESVVGSYLPPTHIIDTRVDFEKTPDKIETQVGIFSTKYCPPVPDYLIQKIQSDLALRFGIGWSSIKVEQFTNVGSRQHNTVCFSFSLKC